MHLPNIRPNERVVRTLGVSGKYISMMFIASVIFLFLAVWAWWLLEQIRDQLGVLADLLIIIVLAIPLLIAFYIVLKAFWLKYGRHYYLTNQRVVEAQGIFSRLSDSSEYQAITDISVYQDPFERMILHTGTISINTAGSPHAEVVMYHVDHPYKIQEEVRQLAEEAGSAVDLVQRNHN